MNVFFLIATLLKIYKSKRNEMNAKQDTIQNTVRYVCKYYTVAK